MPILNWLGKDKVINHQQQVPYRVLEPQYAYGDADSGNMIIHGDNLDALKALLPRYEGKVKLVYIDPPYNTGNENWIYNDNVNDPKIRRWLGKVVGKEGEDLSRHDKWLCMMYPRLKLLQRLLADDGAIFISIDDNEQASLRFICDEIFGAANFVSKISWQRTYAPRSDSKSICNEVEYAFVYGKRKNWSPRKLPRTERMDSSYKRIDGDKTLWRADNPCAADSAQHQGMVYGIQHPFTGEIIYPPAGSHWRINQQQLLEIMSEWANYELRDIDDAAKRAEVCSLTADTVRPDVMAIMLSDSLEEARISAKKRYDAGSWPLFYFTKGGRGGIARKCYMREENGRVVTNLWLCNETGHTDEAKKVLKNIFNSAAGFDTPKPPRLIERIVEIATDPESIVLDSFAGSGTTAHAVLNRNKADGGHRKFILVEMEGYADQITAERVKRVIDGYTFSKDQEEIIFDEKITVKNLPRGQALLEKAKKAAKEAEGRYDRIKKPKIVDGCLQVTGVKKSTGKVEGTGGGFDYFELGERLLLEDGNLNENLDVEKIREYVWYAETRADYTPQEEEYLLGVRSNTAYYLYYEKERITVLDHDFLHSVKTKAGSYLIYADINTLGEEEMDAANIQFKKIPRDITKL